MLEVSAYNVLPLPEGSGVGAGVLTTGAPPPVSFTAGAGGVALGTVLPGWGTVPELKDEPPPPGEPFINS